MRVVASICGRKTEAHGADRSIALMPPLCGRLLRPIVDEGTMEQVDTVHVCERCIVMVDMYCLLLYLFLFVLLFLLLVLHSLPVPTCLASCPPAHTGKLAQRPVSR